MKVQRAEEFARCAVALSLALRETSKGGGPLAPAEVEAASVAGGPAAAAHHPGRTPRTRRAGRTHVNPAVEPTPADLATEAVLTLF